MTYTVLPTPSLKYLYELSSGLARASRRSRPHEGTGVCSATDFIGVSDTTVMPEVSFSERATEAGTTKVVDLEVDPMTGASAPKVVSNSAATVSAYLAVTESMTYSSVRSKGTDVTKSTFFRGSGSAGATARLMPLSDVPFVPIRTTTPAAATRTTAAATAANERTDFAEPSRFIANR